MNRFDSTNLSLAKQRTLVVVASALTWSLGLFLGFFLDDIHNLENALQAPWTLAGMASSFTVFDPTTASVWCLDHQAVHFFRPLFVLSLKLDHLIWGFLPFGFHLSNLLLHTVNSLLVLALLRRTGLGSGMALWASLLFAAFPHHTVAVLWISGRTELLMATFVLASLYWHIRASTEALVWRSRALSLVFAALAFGTKEGAVVVPLLAFLLEMLTADSYQPFMRRARRAFARIWPLALLTVIYLALRLGVMGLADHPPKPYFFAPLDPVFPLFLAVKTIYYYCAWVFALPIMPVAPVAYLLSTPVALALVSLLTVAAWTFVVWRSPIRQSRWLWLGWTAACLVPTAPVMASNHYTYLANMAVAVLAVSVAITFGPRVRKALVAVAVLICAVHALHGFRTYYELGNANQDLARVILRDAPDLTNGKHDLYLANIPFTAAHVGQRIRLLHKAPLLRTHILTVSSEPFSAGASPAASWLRPGLMHLHLGRDWAGSPLVQMFLLTGINVESGRTYPAGPATVAPVLEDDLLVGLDLQLPEPAADLNTTVIIALPEGIRVVRQPARRWPDGQPSQFPGGNRHGALAPVARAGSSFVPHWNCFGIVGLADSISPVPTGRRARPGLHLLTPGISRHPCPPWP